MINRADLLQKIQEARLQMSSVEVKEWKSTIHVREMSAEEKDDFETKIVTYDADGNRTIYKDLNYRAMLVRCTVCDEDGNLLFTDDDVPMLAKQSARVLDKIITKASKLNKMSEEDKKELTKN